MKQNGKGHDLLNDQTQRKNFDVLNSKKNNFVLSIENSNRESLLTSKKILEDEFFREWLKDIKIILLQHILTDTEEFIRHLDEAGASILAVFGKPNSFDTEVVDRLKANHYVEINEYSLYDNSNYLLDFIKKAIKGCKRDNCKILILEVGGYFVKPLTQLDEHELSYVAGSVEVTTFGHNRYENNINEIKVPVFSVARSPIKVVEAKHVGHAVLEGTNLAFRELKRSIRNSTGLMIGYGMIGRSVVRSMKNWGVSPIVYDKSYQKLLDAETDDIQIQLNLSEALSKADLIFSSTATRGLYYSQMLDCKDGAILVSAGSRTNEFDVHELEKRCLDKERISNHLVEYTLENNKTIIVLNKGKAANFLVGSCPDKIVDLIFSEVLQCARSLCDPYQKNENSVLKESSYVQLEDISRIWLSTR